jgi:hypothetical protein
MGLHALGHEDAHDLDATSRRQIPVGMKALRLDGTVVGVPGDEPSESPLTATRRPAPHDTVRMSP